MVKSVNRKTFFYKSALLLSLVQFSGNISAKEGMWLPPTLKNREADMKALGLNIPIEKIYNEDGTGLNNAVALFGKGCTGEVISSQGLVLTNHHCGYGTVQGLSSKEHDYFAEGFWAMNNNEELPCPGLTVNFVRRMENVTDNILNGIADTIIESSRDSIISIRIKNLEKGYKHASGMDAVIKPYFNGNQYWVSIIETFRDVRLVGFPPNGIGSFGGDTDNWMWPRHTGDFSIFRIYAGKDNKPADYDKANQPYKTNNFLTINAAGYKEGDFTMVYGFPGTTMEYISSYQLNQVYSIIDPIRIEARTRKLNVWNNSMAANRDVFLKYTSKRASIANGWKKWQGEVRGLQTNNVLNIKLQEESMFQGWASRDESLPYADELLMRIGAKSNAINHQIKADEYIKEAVLGIELIQQGANLDKMLKVMRAGIKGEALQDTLSKLAATMDGFYKNYDAPTDKQVFTALMPLYFDKCRSCVPDLFDAQYTEQKGSYESWANNVFKSMLADEQRVDQFAANATIADSNVIKGDPAWQLYNAITEYRRQNIAALNSYNSDMITYNRLYMKAQMSQQRVDNLYPDANMTLRLSYGVVKGIDPEGPAGYSYQTNLDEAIAKHNPDVSEFTVPQKLKNLYNAKDYGRWGVNGTVPIAFIANNHTSGGNSGSPVLNAKGQLIGTNFDRIWEGTMSDYYFNENLSRNISLDVRYTLFVIEKFGGAGWLLKEMNIVTK
jgi:hypothetical protein